MMTEFLFYMFCNTDLKLVPKEDTHKIIADVKANISLPCSV